MIAETILPIVQALSKEVAVLYTNTDVLVLGNANEPVLVEIYEKIKDDNSGQDKLEVQIFGETILQPQRISL